MFWIRFNLHRFTTFLWSIALKWFPHGLELLVINWNISEHLVIVDLKTSSPLRHFIGGSWFFVLDLDIFIYLLELSSWITIIYHIFNLITRFNCNGWLLRNKNMETGKIIVTFFRTPTFLHVIHHFHCTLLLYSNLCCTNLLFKHTQVRHLQI